MKVLRKEAIATASSWKPTPAATNGHTPDKKAAPEAARLEGFYGADVFSEAVMRQRLPRPVFKTLMRTIKAGERLDPLVADIVASAMKDWAIENGATHYTHWFQPMTGSTAEK